MKLRNACATLLCGAALSLSIAASPAAATVVASTTPIAVVDGGETTSTINVSGLSGKITGLTLSLAGLSHTYPDDLVFGLLNESAGLGFVFFSGVGGSADISNLDLTFSDAAKAALPESFVGGALTSGTYGPANYGQYQFTFFDNATSFTGFNGLSANGAWTLYVEDVFPADGGSISRGWSLDFTTDAVAAVPEPATWAMMLAGFGMVGFAARRRSSVKTTVTFA